MTHAAESLHWYTRKGGVAYEVEAAKGGLRPATLRDARKLGLVPSVTSIIRCAAAPGLERWKQDQVLMAALTLPKKPDEPEAEYIARIVRDSQEQGKKAAERGTAVHAAIQGAFEGEATPSEYRVHVDATLIAVCDWVDAQWTAERSFAHPLGYGGKVDLSCDQAVIDFKTKEFGPNDKLKTWDEHAMQLAAYREGLGIPNAKCAIVYVSVSNPGLAQLIEIEEEGLKKGWKMFQGLLAYWQAKSGYVSSFEERVAA